MKKVTKADRIHPLDYKFMEQMPEGDPDFNPEHNKWVIEQSIKNYEANRKKKEHEHDEGIKERAQAASTYLEAVSKGGRTTDIETYFGKRHHAYLRGQEVIDRIKDQLVVAGVDGKVIRKPD